MKNKNELHMNNIIKLFPNLIHYRASDNTLRYINKKRGIPVEYISNKKTCAPASNQKNIKNTVFHQFNFNKAYPLPGLTNKREVNHNSVMENETKAKAEYKQNQREPIWECNHCSYINTKIMVGNLWRFYNKLNQCGLCGDYNVDIEQYDVDDDTKNTDNIEQLTIDVDNIVKNGWILDHNCDVNDNESANCSALKRICCILNHFQTLTQHLPKTNNIYPYNMNLFLSKLPNYDAIKYLNDVNHIRNHAQIYMSQQYSKCTYKTNNNNDKCPHLNRGTRNEKIRISLKEKQLLFNTKNDNDFVYISYFDRTHCELLHYDDNEHGIRKIETMNKDETKIKRYQNIENEYDKKENDEFDAYASAEYEEDEDDEKGQNDEIPNMDVFYKHLMDKKCSTDIISKLKTFIITHEYDSDSVRYELQCDIGTYDDLINNTNIGIFLQDNNFLKVMQTYFIEYNPSI
eukprot:395376_1